MNVIERMYEKIRAERNERLSQILTVLEQKACADPELGMVAEHLRTWFWLREGGEQGVRQQKAPEVHPTSGAVTGSRDDEDGGGREEYTTRPCD